MIRIVKHIAVIFLTVVAFSACDFCGDTTGNGTKGDVLIYLTTFPESTDLPAIYEFDIDNNSFRNVVDNGIVYSPPSLDNKLLFQRNNGDKEQMLIKDLTTNTETLIEESNSLFDIATPKLSYDGKIAVFYGGNSKLYAYNIKDKAIDKISDEYESLYGFSISPDGKKIAFFEMIETGIYNLMVLDATAFDEVVYSKQYSGINFTQGLNKQIQWSETGTAVMFSCTQNIDEPHIMIDYMNGNVRDIAISKNLGANYPVLSPDENFIAFVSDYGEIWIRSLNSEDPVFSKISERGTLNAIASQLFWLASGKDLYYIQSIDLGSSSVFKDLLSVELSIDKSTVTPEMSSVLCSNVFNAMKMY